MSDLARVREATGYRQTQDGVVALGDEVLPEVAQALDEPHTVVMDREDGASDLIVPILLRGQPLGALGLRFDGGAKSISPDDITLAESVGEQFALAAENLRLLDETQRRAARERVTSEAASRIRESLDTERVLESATDEIYRALGLESVVIRLKMAQDGADYEGSTTDGGEVGASQEEAV